MPIEMIWNDLKFFLIDQCVLKTKRDLIKGIRKFWALKMENLPYCNSKFNHLYKVVDRTIAVCGRATGL